MAHEVTHDHPDNVIVNETDRDSAPANNNGAIVAVIVLLVIILLLVFGRGMFGGRSGGGTTNVNVPAPTTTPGQ